MPAVVPPHLRLLEKTFSSLSMMSIPLLHVYPLFSSLYTIFPAFNQSPTIHSDGLTTCIQSLSQDSVADEGGEAMRYNQVSRKYTYPQERNRKQRRASWVGPVGPVGPVGSVVVM